MSLPRQLRASQLVLPDDAVIVAHFYDIESGRKELAVRGHGSAQRYSFEFRVGGEWDFVMHRPDGTDYAEWISWTEIAAPERIALLHGESPGDPNAFESV